MQHVTVTVNGRRWSGEVRDGASLLDLLRDRVHLTGAKLGCGEGQCGSCTVLVDGRVVSACTTPAARQRAKTVVTVEGLAAGTASCIPCSRPSSTRRRSSAASARPA
jgi:aerobic-type carbon monoxide dehydrogenase small subunit (CoxS/CutS family)